MRYLFDVGGTLAHNPVLSDQEMERALRLLKAQGHELYAWTGCTKLVPAWVQELMIEVTEKPSRPVSDGIMVDDEPLILKVYGTRCGFQTMSALDFGRAMLKLLEECDVERTC